jgi:hypothetical protein
MTPRQETLTERLEHLRVLEEAAYLKVDPRWRIDLRPPASQEALDRIEKQLGRRFSNEGIELYRWHDGSDGGTWFVPLIHFNPLHQAHEVYAAAADAGSFAVTNAPRTVEMLDLFPAFQHERLLFSLHLDPGSRLDTSSLYVVDLEQGHVIEEARTLRDYIDHLIELFEHGHYAARGRELEWKAAPYRIEPDMEPYGSHA